MRLLILGGTSEARRLAERLAGDQRFQPVLSLAGRTEEPIASPIKTRIGGFGGADGLRDWITTHNIDAVIDATHPFANQISANAVVATRSCDMLLGSLVRPAWMQVPGDHWTEAANIADAIVALGDTPRRVFLTVGRLGLSDFVTAPHHVYIARTIDPPGEVSLPPKISFYFDRGPFAVDDEMTLMRKERINIIVTKNSGGTATYAKIEAARRLGLPVIMIARPAKPQGHLLPDIDAAMAWLDGLRHTHSSLPSSERDV